MTGIQTSPSHQGFQVEGLLAPPSEVRVQGKLQDLEMLPARLQVHLKHMDMEGILKLLAQLLAQGLQRAEPDHCVDATNPCNQKAGTMLRRRTTQVRATSFSILVLN